MTDHPEIVEEQKDYYRARASEYDDWFYRRGRYDFGPEHTKQWEDEAEVVRQRLKQVNLTGDVLEIAAGTGIWTQEVLKTARHVTALDSSVEVLEINHNKSQAQNLTTIVADIFQWQPQKAYDAVFMGFWLSHVPPARLPDFISLVNKALKSGGKIFFVDSLPTPSSTAKDMVQNMAQHVAHGQNKQAIMKRRLGDGREFQIIKIYYEPDELAGHFRSQGLDMIVTRTNNFFLYGWGHK